MNDEDLAMLYRRTLEPTAGRPEAHCPPLERLRAVAEDGPGEGERLSVMDHVSRCLPCQRDLALLTQVVATRPRSRWYRARPWMAAAATAVLALVGLRSFGLRETSVLRGERETTVITVSPAGTVTRGTVGSLVWRGVPGATRFEVEILTTEGELIFSDTVRDTVALVSPPITTVGEYRWRVTAVQADGERAPSALVAFVVVPE